MLYLIRHGSTDQQALRPPGDLTPATQAEWLLDHGLSQAGQGEARLLRERLPHMVPADRYLASPRRRTQETAQLALPSVTLTIDERLHEWRGDESMPDLFARCRWLLQLADTDVCMAFTHGGFIRAVMAAVLVGDAFPRFEATFHDLRRMLHVWNASVTIVGHGANGLEIYGVNLCQPIEALAGRK